jgi:penicillin-binding protein 1A
MKVAVAGRPVEKFQTEMTAPAWQLDSDDQANFSGNPDDYYYVDENGNLIEPTPRGQASDRPGPDPRDDQVGDPNGTLEPVAPPAAANDDFLNEATGKKSGGQSRPPQ